MGTVTIAARGAGAIGMEEEEAADQVDMMAEDGITNPKQEL